MINKNNHYLKIKVDDKAFDFVSQFSDDFDVSISNFGEFCINFVIAYLGFITEGLSDSSVDLFIQIFANNINNMYRTGARSKS